MKNKIMAVTAAAILASALAFGFVQYSKGGSCCGVETSACCTAGQDCPVECCK